MVNLGCGCKPRPYPILDIPDSPTSSYCACVTILTDLYAFYLDHRRCGELDGGVEEIKPSEWCTCGAVMTRRADEEVVQCGNQASLRIASRAA